jgi:hypothetical protein
MRRDEKPLLYAAVTDDSLRFPGSSYRGNDTFLRGLERSRSSSKNHFAASCFANSGIVIVVGDDCRGAAREFEPLIGLPSPAP